jgi:hypothetical protein
MIHPEPIPLGVCDPHGRVGAVARNQVDIDVIDLAHGGLRQRLAATGSVLMIDSGCLIGWHGEADNHELRLFRLPLPPSDRGAEWSPPVHLPAWVSPRAPENTDFAIKFGRDGDTYSLFWRARGHYRGGAPPPRDLLAEIARQVAVECIDFDVATLAVLRRRNEDGFEDDASHARRGEELARHAAGMVYRRAGQLHNAPWMTPDGERFLRKLSTVGSGAQLVSLARSDVLTAGSIVSIRAVEPETMVPELSLDGRHMAVVEQTPGGMVWSIYSTLTGVRVGRFPYSDGFQSFRAFDQRLIYLEQRSANDSDITIRTTRTLHAMAMDGGELLWSHELEPMVRRNRKFLRP